jgi:hypothetical protein
MWNRVVGSVRLLAAILVLVFLPGWLPLQPVLADAGTCSPTEKKGCITANDAYPEKACTAGQGEECITCDYDPGSVCTWIQGEKDLSNYADEIG